MIGKSTYKKDDDVLDISFDWNWSRNDIRAKVKENCYLYMGFHEDLKCLCVLQFEGTENKSDYSEMSFVVPTWWLGKAAKTLFGVDNLDYWLQNEYTTDESKIIFEKALNDRQVVMVDFSE